MNKKKGFTLIELLAVIVILAIIALIATPIILNIIEKARKEAFVDTAYGIINAAELQYTEGIMDNKVEEKLYTFPQSGEDKLKFSRGEPKGGDIKISSTGKVSIAIHNGDWCAKKMEDQSEVIVTEYAGQCSLVEITYTPEECFTFDKTTGTITNYDKSNDKCGIDVVIPEKIDGVTVKVIGSSSFMHGTKYINSVVFPSGLEEIKDKAFLGYEYFNYMNMTFNNITSLDFSKSKKLKAIGNSAFEYNQLTSVVIPDSVTSIGQYAFRNNQLTSVEIPSTVTTIYMNSFPTAVMNNYYDTDGFLIINGNLLDYTGASKEIIIPEGVTSIGDSAFEDNQLTSVTIGNSVKAIGDYAFMSNQLTSVVIPEGVEIIEYMAFRSNQLTSVIIKGKSSSADFTTYDSYIWGWATGYSDTNIIWEGKQE